MAQSLIGPGANNAWEAAPVPRKPQPIHATLSSAPPDAWAVLATFHPLAIAIPATVAVVRFRKSRRVELLLLFIRLLLVGSRKPESPALSGKRPKGTEGRRTRHATKHRSTRNDLCPTQNDRNGLSW
jgi:hypothetical protein